MSTVKAQRTFSVLKSTEDKFDVLAMLFTKSQNLCTVCQTERTFGQLPIQKIKMGGNWIIEVDV